MTGIVMRKLILVAAMSLLATEVLAGGSRGLSLAASGTSQQAEQQATTATTPRTTQAPPASQSTNVQTAATAPTSAATATTAPAASTAPVAAPASTSPAQPAATREATTTDIAKPKRRQSSTGARVIRELHRHGIYW
jgi:predicted lipid-binding transport protein (Tim44 family)